MTIPGKRYLGDGAYVEFDGYAFVLTTEDGIRVTNTVVLELDVYLALADYVQAVLDARRLTIPQTLKADAE